MMLIQKLFFWQSLREIDNLKLQQELKKAITQKFVSLQNFKRFLWHVNKYSSSTLKTEPSAGSRIPEFENRV